MKRKTGNLRTTKRMVTGVEVLPNGTGGLVREQIGNVEERIQDSMVFHTQLWIIFDEGPGNHSAVLCARENDGC
jgi:hypothetical protein